MHQKLPVLEVMPKPEFEDRDFNLNPFIVFWEVTQACHLACLHCRAKAQTKRNPKELTTEEGFKLIEDIASLQKPLLVITGGDPMMRPDLFEFIKYSSELGLRVSLAPSATRLITPERMEKAKKAGIIRVSFSLDGSEAKIHDSFRQTPGSFERTLSVIEYSRKAGISLQINTTISRYNFHDIENMAKKVAELGALMWSVFFLVPTGRGKNEDMISPQQHEEAFSRLYELSRVMPFDIKTTAAEHYRRFVLQHKKLETRRGESETRQGEMEAGNSPAADSRTLDKAHMTLAGPGFSFQDGIGRPSKGVNDGDGCCFISHIGEVCPSGFLPLPGGNIRQTSLREIYRSSPLFVDLRDKLKLKGKCGVCNYNSICGGSRARAYAVTGDYLEAEPYCIYEPPAWKKLKEYS